MCLYLHSCKCVSIDVLTHTHTHTHTHIHMYTHTHTHAVSVCMITYTYMLHTHTCIYTCMHEHACQQMLTITLIGWLRLVGSLKLQVSFAEYCIFYRALLQKRPINSRSLLIVTTSYVLCGMCCVLFTIFNHMRCVVCGLSNM